jgi:rubrerythrin
MRIEESEKMLNHSEREHVQPTHISSPGDSESTCLPRLYGQASGRENREELVRRLNFLLSREYNSLIHYIHDANPYVPEEKRPAFRLLEEMIADEQRHAEQLGNLIIQLEGIPQPAPYDVSIADINYLSLDYLARMMIKEKEELVAEYEQLIAQLGGATRGSPAIGIAGVPASFADRFPEVRNALERILIEEKKHLDILKTRFSECESELP